MLSLVFAGLALHGLGQLRTGMAFCWVGFSLNWFWAGFDLLFAKLAFCWVGLSFGLGWLFAGLAFGLRVFVIWFI